MFFPIMGDVEPTERIMEHIEMLALRIGPRAPTSENEKKAAEYIGSILKERGLEVNIDEFSSPSTFSWYYGVPCFLIFLSFLVYRFHPIFGLIVSISGAIFFFLEINTIESVSRVFPKRESQNVIGRIKPEKSIKKRLVVVVHHDTSKASLSFDPRFVRFFRVSIILLIFSVLYIPLIFCIGMVLSILDFAFYLTLPFSLYLLTSVLILVHRELSYEHVQGANDNASGVGVLLGLGEAFSSSKLKSTEVWFLSTGCEEVSTIGMIRFLNHHGNELKDAYFINIDNVGKGLIRYTMKEGLIRGFKCSETLIKLARTSASKTKIDAKEFVSKKYPTNALPCLVRGYQAISILSTDKNGLIHNWHWKTDTFRNLDQSAIKNAYEIVLDMAMSLDGDR